MFRHLLPPLFIRLLISLRDLGRTLLDETALLIPDLAVRRGVLGEDHLLQTGVSPNAFVKHCKVRPASCGKIRA